MIESYIGAFLSLEEKQFNFYLNSIILIVGGAIIFWLLKRNNRDLDDFNSYNWNKFVISSDGKQKYKKSEAKEKTKTRVKEFSKGNGFIKEENRFPVLNIENKKSNEDLFLTFEEGKNLQDMINYAATMNNDKESMYPIESLYSRVMTSKEVTYNTNDKIDQKMNEILINSNMSDNLKVQEILNLYSQLMRMKIRNLSEQTYIGIVEVSMRNGNLNHASYFLCQMDRLKINIPRKLLDMFLDYSISHHYFEKNKETELIFEDKPFQRKGVTNKFDEYSPTEPEFEYYFNRKNQYKNRINDIETVYKKLRLDAKPYVPKKISDSKNNEGNVEPKNISPEKKISISPEEDGNNGIKTSLSSVDPSKIKDFIPKSVRNTKKRLDD